MRFEQVSDTRWKVFHNIGFSLGVIVFPKTSARAMFLSDDGVTLSKAEQRTIKRKLLFIWEDRFIASIVPEPCWLKTK